MSLNFLTRVSERFDNNCLNIRARTNEIDTMEDALGSLPDIKTLQRALENLLIKGPGMPLIFLYTYASESVATLRFKTQEKTEKIMDPQDILDMDYKDLSPVTRDLENGIPVKVQYSMNGIPTGSNRK